MLKTLRGKKIHKLCLKSGKLRLKRRITRFAFERSSARRQKETKSILMRSAEF